ncbi:PREDICTED: 32 kDa beta-galactoside-binding lectin-like [Chrysochloris asiatica]|uniref:Galectin n=1 Tax=Chrysochloris asiatica TaxID=185453 RepID=A0A9B0WRK1_CHRAS|nr:PREDICTED: 32 kDa beta-galactoside-binding lectin-like [Chrysochloris asiatica]
MQMNLGKTLRIKGKLSNDVDQVAINLGQSAEKMNLHFNPRFKESYIALNSFNGSWGEEKRVPINCFGPGSEVTFHITFETHQFKIMLPNDNVVTFPNRMDNCQLSYLHANFTITNMQMNLGKTLRIKGKLSNDVDQVAINLGQSAEKRNLHFNPRFKESYIVLNSFNGGWGEEIRVPINCFGPGSEVTFHITFQKHQFEIMLPNDNVVTFPNRMDNCQLSYLQQSCFRSMLLPPGGVLENLPVTLLEASCSQGVQVHPGWGATGNLENQNRSILI